MNATLVATIGGSATALCWGAGDWLSAKSARKLTPQQVNLAVQAFDTLLGLLIFLFADVHMPALHQVLAIGGGGLLITLAYLIFVRALVDGPVGVIVPIGNSYPLITVILSVAILSETVSAGQMGAMVGIIIGAAVLAYQKNTRKVPVRELHKDTLLAVIAAMVWGLGFFVQNTVVKDLSWQTVLVTMEAATTLITVTMFTATYRSKAIAAGKQALTHKPALLAGVVGAAGFIGLYLGADKAGSLIIPAVLSACGPLVTSALGAVIDHERLGALKRVGAVIVVAGVIVLNLA
jgi:drug/metabolite transporter (DMT)-like permease